MKFDQNKPSLCSFYWDGLAGVVKPSLSAIIKAYQAFSNKPSISMSIFLFNACRDYYILYHPFEIKSAYDHGARKYGDKNYLSLTLDRYLDAFGRHLLKICFGHEIDEESGLRHSAHLLANLFIMAELLILQNRI